MKKNITINLFGTLYNIDEDACRLLEQYIESMKSYFCRQEGGEEIADDIEHRVAELLWQQKQQGVEAVNIDHIRHIIGVIGNPAEIDDRPGEASQAEEESSETGSAAGCEEAAYEEVKDGNGQRFQRFAREAGDAMKQACKEGRNFMRGRHLYRDGNDKLLGGVLSGLAKYFDVSDPLWFRLGFLLLIFFLPIAPRVIGYSSVGFWTFIYLMLWIMVPEAVTAEDVLRMKGERVTPETLNEEILRQNESTTPKRDVPQQVRNSGCLRILFGLLVTVLLFPFFVLLIVAVCFMVFMGNVGSEVLGNVFGYDHLFDHSFGAYLMTGNTWSMWLCIGSSILVAGIPIYYLIRALRTNKKPLGTAAIVVSVSLWLVAVATMIGSVIITGERYDNWRDSAEIEAPMRMEIFQHSPSSLC